MPTLERLRAVRAPVVGIVLCRTGGCAAGATGTLLVAVSVHRSRLFPQVEALA